VPDLILAHCGSWAMAAKFPTDNDAFKTYIKRLRARPAFERAANI
jgi:glutathione S-transferase